MAPEYLFHSNNVHLIVLIWQVLRRQEISREEALDLHLFLCGYYHMSSSLSHCFYQHVCRIVTAIFSQVLTYQSHDQSSFHTYTDQIGTITIIYPSVFRPNNLLNKKLHKIGLKPSINF